MVALLKRLSVKAHKDAGWPGILVGDMGQPRGGPALSGHASHQIGLDADIWLTPMPDHRLSREEREEMSAVMMVRADRLDIDPQGLHAGSSRGDPRRRAGAAACSASSSMPRSRRRCAARPRATAAGSPRSGRGGATTITSTSAWHVRPAAAECKGQPPPDGGEGCSAGDLAYWFKDSVLHPKPPPEPPKPQPPMTLAQLPAGLPPGAGGAGREAIDGSQRADFIRLAKCANIGHRRAVSAASLIGDDGPALLISSMRHRCAVIAAHGLTL